MNSSTIALRLTMLSSMLYSGSTYSKYSPIAPVLNKKSNKQVSFVLPFPSGRTYLVKWENFSSHCHLSLPLLQSMTSFRSEAGNNSILCFWDLQLLSIGSTVHNHNSWKYTIFLMKLVSSGSVFLRKRTSKVERFECGANKKLNNCHFKNIKVVEECRNVEIL